MKHHEESWEDEPTNPFARLQTARVLIAEDDDALRSMIATRLRSDGCEVIEVENGDQALELIAATEQGLAANGPLDLVVMDVRMPGLSGLDVLELLRSWRWTIPVLFVTAYPDNRLIEQASRLGATVLAKPFGLSRLSRAANDTLCGRLS